MKKPFRLPGHPLYFLGAILILLNTAWMTPKQVLQTQSLEWSSPDIIQGIDLKSNPPILVADDNKTVHAFVSQDVGDAGDSIRAIVYSQWTLDYGWSAPIDIIVSPIREARVTSAYLDKNGIMHLIFYGGNSISGDIYYTRAYASVAGNATSWSTPALVGEDAGDPESAVLVGDGQDQLSIIYHGKRDGYGVYVVNSSDAGNSWSSPSPIFLSDGDAPYIFSLQAVTSTSGWYHVIWNTFTQSGQGRTIYYARSKIGDSEWSDPIALSSVQEGLGTQTPTIIEYKNVLFAIYNLTPKITMRRSIDNGLTWDDPIVLFSRHIGVNGPPSLVIDGRDELHMFFGQRIPGSTGNPDIHGMWHSLWTNGHWMEPDAVVKGPRVLDKIGNSSFDPVSAHAVVSQGNVILVTWSQDPDPNIKPNGVWYSYAVMNIAELTVETLQPPPQTVPTATFNPSLTSVLLDTPTSLPASMLENRPNWSPISSLIVGLILVSLFLGMFVINSRNNHR